jgi:O-antigen/teichoic acid export membrane protein
MAEAVKKESSLASRAFWLMFAKTLGFAFTFILPPLLVRHLTQSEYGLFKQIFLVVGTAIAVLPLNFGMSAYYFLPREDGYKRKQVVFNVLLFSTFVGVLACLVLILRPQLLTNIFNDSTLVQYGPLIGIVILFWVISSFLETVAVANQETRLSTVFIISAQLTKTLFMLAALLLFGTLRALIYASLIQGVFQTLLLLFYLHSRFPHYWRSFDWAMLRTQMTYAMPLGFAGLLFTVQTDLHNYFISHRFSPAEFAIYSIGCLELPLLSVLKESINSVMIPRVSFLQKESETREILLLTARVMRKLAFFFFPAYALLMVVGREFITFLFTANYLASWPIFAINMTLLPLGVLALDPVLRAFAEHRYFLLKLRVYMFVFLIAGLWYGSVQFGMIGVVGTIVLISIIERIAMVIKFGRVLNVSSHDLVLLKDVGKLALASVLAAITTMLVRSLMLGLKPFYILALCGSVFSLVYLAMILLLKVITSEEFDFVRGHVSRLQRRIYLKRAADTLS